jgi:Flp pilus assembly protein TadD
MSDRRHLSHAQGYLALGLLAEAAAALAAISPAQRDSAEVQAVRLALLQEQEDWPALRDLACELIRRDPAESAAWVMWAYATRRADSLESAERILLEAELIHPAEPTIQFNLGCYACVRGDLVTARSRVDRAIALDRKFAAAARTDPDLAALRAGDRRRDPSA